MGSNEVEELLWPGKACGDWLDTASERIEGVWSERGCACWYADLHGRPGKVGVHSYKELQAISMATVAGSVGLASRILFLRGIHHAEVLEQWSLGAVSLSLDPRSPEFQDWINESCGQNLPSDIKVTGVPDWPPVPTEVLRGLNV